jgi:hypothetical protein
LIKILFKKQKTHMKKLLVVFAIAGSLVACNNAADSTADAKDSVDSVATEKKEMIDSTAEQKMDKIDSTAAQAKDSLNKIDSAAKK